MRNLWVRIGLGAGLVFGAGMFFLTLGRQVKSSIAETVDHGGRFRIPLAVVPFSIDHNRVGHIQEVDVRRSEGGLKRLNLVVKLEHDYDAEDLSGCVFVLDSPHTQGMFDCVQEGSPEAAEYTVIGQLRMEPSGLVRPLVVSQREARDWLDGMDAEHVKISTESGGAVIQVTDAEGTKVVDISAGAEGAQLKVKGENGEQVEVTAGSTGVDVRKKPAQKQQP